ncbi:calcium-binding protein [Puniceibacterium sp. IMCC21224]|uniref:calcium-binding protein n=1 Tax=Puniceibacterium sp. IMCC21224 TaxID=1618204 RepID=UPI00065D01CB|nr:calcium-binding protein [Puniceibacterium sp. IMCC21224]KMK63979.1 putative calcium-binding protein [Puniceibacterium sp. IMCC21224]
MTTYTLDAYFYRPVTGVQDFAFSELAIVMAPAVNSVTYSYADPQGTGMATPVTLAGAGLYTLLLGGAVIPESTRSDSVVTLNWGAGQTSVAYQIDLGPDLGRYLVPLGGDPIGVADAAGFATFLASITAVRDVTSGGFAAGAEIALGGLPGVRLTQNDIIVGSTGNDTLSGAAGADLITALDGDDLLNPGSWAHSGMGSDSLLAGPGNDTIALPGTGSLDIALLHYDLDAGISVNIGGPGTNGIIDKGVNGITTVADIRPMNLLIGGTFSDDVITATNSFAGSITVVGLEGNDTFHLPTTGSASVGLDYSDPRSTSGIVADLGSGIIANDGFGFSDILTGRVTHLIATMQADDITGHGPAEQFYTLMAGDDTLDGGAGRDWVHYDDPAAGAVTVDLGLGTATGTWAGQAFVHTLINVEGIYGSARGDSLTGGAGGDTLYGEGGDDTLTGGLGDDSLIGGGGTDTAILGVMLADVVITIRGASVQIVSAMGSDVYSDDIERFQFTDALLAYGDLPIGGPGRPGVLRIGTDRADWLEGTSSDDTLAGGAGDDRLEGHEGHDNLSGSDGNDRIDGGGGDDQIGGGTGSDTLDGGAGNDTIGAGQGDDSAAGGEGDDIVNGGAGNDTLDGGAGNDTMGASFGNDFVRGGAGGDSLGGGAGRDTLDGGTGNDSIGGGEGDDRITGGDGRDFLAGGGRNDDINGGTGRDTLNGGAGDDTLTGGGGADVFVFNAFVAGEYDLITDFTAGLDSFRMTGVQNAPGTGLQGRVDALMITDALIDGQAGVTLTWEGHVIGVVGVAAADLGTGDFVFV